MKVTHGAAAEGGGPASRGTRLDPLPSREELAAVERDEQRLAAGMYGLSIESGEPIPDERLEAVPTRGVDADEERARTER